MSNPQKNKGSRFERKIVEICELHDLKAVRAWGSNGLALGQHPECDVLINDVHKNAFFLRIIFTKLLIQKYGECKRKGSGPT